MNGDVLIENNFGFRRILPATSPVHAVNRHYTIRNNELAERHNPECMPKVSSIRDTPQPRAAPDKSTSSAIPLHNAFNMRLEDTKNAVFITTPGAMGKQLSLVNDARPPGHR